jgi:hypothetical protein
MSALQQQKLVRKGLDLGFDLGGELVRNLSLSKGPAGDLVGVVPPGTFTVAVKGMVTNYRDQAIPGALALVGDEKIMVRAAELEALMVPAAGDYLEEVSGFVRRRIVAALLDPTASFWMFQTRRLDDSLIARVTLTFGAGAELSWFEASALFEMFASGTLQIDPTFAGSASLDLAASASLSGDLTLEATANLALDATATTLTVPAAPYFLLTGPSTIANGQSAQYTATLYYSDGSSVIPPFPTWAYSGHIYVSMGSNPATVLAQSVGASTLQAAAYYGGVVYQSNYLAVTVT